MTRREYLFNLHKQALLDNALWLPWDQSGRHGRDRGWFIRDVCESAKAIEDLMANKDPWLDEERDHGPHWTG
jgi:hypothetical protein